MVLCPVSGLLSTLRCVRAAQASSSISFAWACFGGGLLPLTGQSFCPELAIALLVRDGGRDHAEVGSEDPASAFCVTDFLAASDFFPHELNNKTRRVFKTEYPQFLEGGEFEK